MGQLKLSAGAVGSYLPHYVELAAQAGLTSPTTIRGSDRKDFLLSTTGGGVAVFDYDNDEWPDVFIVNGWGLADFPRGQEPTNHLYRNNRDGTFTDVSKAAGILSPQPAYGFTPLVADFDNDGWPDIYVANDSTPSLLFRNNHDGTFTEMGLLAGVAFDLNGRPQAGMGVDTADIDGDGLLDVVKTNFSDEPPTLYHNEGKGFFADATFPSGLGSATESVKWGVSFLDVDNDGWPDLIIANGPIYPPGINPRHPKTGNQGGAALFRNTGSGRFREITPSAGPGFSGSACGRGLAVGDIFHTGQVDVVINNINGCPTLLHNQLPAKNNWLLIKLLGARTNRSALGSRVMVEAGSRRQIQEVRSGGSFCSQSDLRLHFGLGKASRAERLEVRWLGGETQVLNRVAANRLVTIEEGKGIVAEHSW